LAAAQQSDRSHWLPSPPLTLDIKARSPPSAFIQFRAAMEFISRVFGAFLTFFFEELPFPLDEPIPQEPQISHFPKTPAFSQIEQSIFLTPNFEKRWNPPITSTPKIRRVIFAPEQELALPEVKAPFAVSGPVFRRAQLPLEGFLKSVKVDGIKVPLHQIPVKRMGLRI
jgi:hypothetical protein